jgi:hypothetical protein
MTSQVEADAQLERTLAGLDQAYRELADELGVTGRAMYAAMDEIAVATGTCDAISLPTSRRRYHSLLCRPLPSKLLKPRLSVDSNPTGAINRRGIPVWI